MKGSMPHPICYNFVCSKVQPLGAATVYLQLVDPHVACLIRMGQFTAVPKLHQKHRFNADRGPSLYFTHLGKSMSLYVPLVYPSCSISPMDGYK